MANPLTGSMLNELRALAIAGGAAVALTLLAGGAARAQAPETESDEPAAEAAKTDTTDSGITTTTLSDGTVITKAPEGTAEAADQSCAPERVCFWSKKNYKGIKFSVDPWPGTICNTFMDGSAFPVRSLMVGSKEGIASMRTKPNCKGTPSSSYAGGAKVPSIKFNMASFR
ncbi:peptidase inhibitor family I36 protein [Archangium sp. Cb G35]|uniref:peptidase inhibitor family I36 protein n=1 Tax=Archangium sp. Cb G35 TaxID=1920190 RepID=UPI000B1511C0|nr:peptidase inhibitor family I36 protein [Archangium sp. Cb G35]